MSHLDLLYCEENHQWDDDDEEEETVSHCSVDHHHLHTPPTPLEQDLFWEDDELSSLFSRESHHQPPPSPGREAAVEWILAVVSHHSFAALTALLAVDYLDRFLDRFDGVEKKQPWMTHLAAVACLALAAKVEEIHVPLLLDLQVEGSPYVFEAKTIQKMEILILSTLQWRMNPVTPLSFLDYIIRRLHLNTFLSWEFLKRCESLLLCFLPDDSFRCHRPSVTATATMVHVINSVEPCIGLEYQSQLLAILGIDKEKVDDCSKKIQALTCGGNPGRHFHKRRFGTVPGSPNCVMDLSFSSDDSWAAATATNPSFPSSPEPLSKRSRTGAP